MRIYWLKQKVIGLAMIMATMAGAFFMDLDDLCVLAMCVVPLGVSLLVSDDRLFKSEYILEIDFSRLWSKRS